MKTGVGVTETNEESKFIFKVELTRKNRSKLRVLGSNPAEDQITSRVLLSSSISNIHPVT